MATKLSKKDPNPGTWFKFDEDDPESGEICIRAVNDKKRREIDKKCRKKQEIFRKGQRYEKEEIDDALFSEMLWDYVIADWKGLLDDDDNPIECTKDNKVFWMQNSPGFAAFVNDCSELVHDRLEDRLKGQKKTSLSESSEEETSPPATDADD